MSETSPAAPRPPSWMRTPSVARTGILIAGIGILTKITGFVRITALVSHLGAVRSTDAFLTAFLIPETLYIFLTEGAISAAFVPVFTRAALEGRESFHKLLMVTAAFVLLISAAVAILLALAGRQVIAWVAPGFDSSTMEVTRQLLMVVLPYIPLSCVAAVLAAALNASGRFGAAALGPLLFNLAVIASIPFSAKDDLIPLGIGVLVGGFLQLLVQIPVLIHAVGRPPFVITLTHPGVREIITLLLPLTLTNSLIQIQVLVERTISSNLAEGVITNLSLVQRLTTLPLGLIGMAVAVPLFPMLSRAWHEEDRQRYVRLTENGLIAVYALILPLGWLFFLEADALIRALFLRGAYVSEPAAQAAGMLRLYATCLPAISASYLLAGAFLARGESTKPALLKGALHLVNIVMNFYLVSSFDWKTVPGCYSAMFNLNLLLLILLMRMQMPSFSIVRVLGAIAGVTLVWGLGGLAGELVAGPTSLPELARVTVVGVVMTALALPALYGLGRATGVIELTVSDLLSRLRRKRVT